MFSTKNKTSKKDEGEYLELLEEGKRNSVGSYGSNDEQDPIVAVEDNYGEDDVNQSELESNEALNVL